MGLFKRVSDIISANLNELLDGVENPEVMLKQAVREMETALGAAMDSAARVIANEKLTRKQLTEHQSTLDRWHHEAARAVKEGNDERARFALTRKSEQAKLIAAIEDQLQTSAETSLKLRRQIAAMRVRLTEARSKLMHLVARQKAANAQKRFALRLNGFDQGATAFSRFDRMCLKVEQAEAEADALTELTGEWSFSEEIDPGVEIELAALKRQSAEGDTLPTTD